MEQQTVNKGRNCGLHYGTCEHIYPQVVDRAYAMIQQLNQTYSAGKIFLTKYNAICVHCGASGMSHYQSSSHICLQLYLLLAVHT